MKETDEEVNKAPKLSAFAQKHGSFAGKGAIGLVKARGLPYKLYVERCKATDTAPVPVADWLLINRAFCDELLEFSIQGGSYNFPAGLGFFRMAKRKKRYLNLQASIEEFKKKTPEEQIQLAQSGGDFVSSIDWQKEGYLPAPIWDTKQCRFPNRSVFTLRLMKDTFKTLNRRWKVDRTLMFKVINYKDHFK